MKGKEKEPSVARRSFLTRMGMGAGVVGAGVVGAAVAGAPAAAQSAGATWQPTRETQDDWFNQIPGGHRVVFDNTTPEGVALGFEFARNYFTANAMGYQLKASDLAVVLVVRHKSTPFAYNNAMWAKYGKYLSQMSGYVDPKTKQAPKVNVYATQAKGSKEQPLIDVLVGEGAHFAVCNMATQFITGIIARGTGGKTPAIYKELTNNLIRNARMVPAGIVAVNRAQEYGYSYVFAG